VESEPAEDEPQASAEAASDEQAAA
jgi:hypothetical protein